MEKNNKKYEIQVKSIKIYIFTVNKIKLLIIIY